MAENIPPTAAACLPEHFSEEETRLRSGKTENASNKDIEAPRKKRRPLWSKDEWIAAAIARENGYDPGDKLDPVGLGPDCVFQTAEEIQQAMGLDYLPETEEAYTIPFIDGVEPYLLKYCWLKLGDSLDLTGLAEPLNADDNTEHVLINGKQRIIWMVKKLHRQPKNRKLKGSK